MKSFKCLFALLALLAVFTLSGCSGGKMLQTLPSQSELSSIKGWSTAAVERKFGSEYTETFDSNNNKIWTYKKKSDSNGWMTLGVRVLVDVVTIEFHNNKVSSYHYTTSVLNGGLPGMGALSSAMGSIGMGSRAQPESPPEERSGSRAAPKTYDEAKSIVGNTAEKMGLRNVMPFRSETSAPAKTTQKMPSQEKSEAKITISDSRRFNQCSLKGAKKRLCANAQKSGFKIEEKKDGKITLVRESVKVSTSFKQSGKDVLVELTSTGRFTDTALSKDFCKILESCN